MMTIFGAIVVLIAALFGYIFWNRRTMMKPAALFTSALFSSLAVSVSPNSPLQPWRGGWGEVVGNLFRPRFLILHAINNHWHCQTSIHEKENIHIFAFLFNGSVHSFLKGVKRLDKQF